MSLLLLIVLILFLVGGLPSLSYHSYGYAPSGLAGMLGVASAATDVHKMSGVQRVENEGEVGDEEVTREVKKAFDRPAFKDITVEVRNGVVRLTGTVPSWAWRLEAVAVARAIPGVRGVEDELRLMLAV